MTPEQKAAIDRARARREAVARAQEARAQPLEIDGANLYTPQNAGMFPEPPGRSQRVNAFDPVQGDVSGISDAARGARENVVGDDDPTTQNTGEKVGTWLNKAGEAMTFGTVGDEASAAAAAAIPGGMGHDERLEYERGQEKILERDNPGAALGAEFGGSVLGAMLPLGVVGTLGRSAKVAPRIAASMGAGISGGATYGAMEGEGGEDRLSGAKRGALWGAAGGAAALPVGAGVQKIADALVRRGAIKEAARGALSTDDLRAQAKSLYDEADRANVQIKPSSFDRLRDGMSSSMVEVGMDELPGPGSLTPKSARVNQIAQEMSAKMAEDPTAALPFRSLDQLRRHAGTAAADVSPMMGRATPDGRVGTAAVSSIDDYVRVLGPDDIASGDVETLQEVLPKAREIYARMSKSQMIDDALENSENYVSGRASGIRNQFRRILSNKNMSRGFTEVEKAVMQKVAQGSIPEQMLYAAGGAIGNLGAIGVGSAGGPIGTMLGVGAAYGLRKGAETVAERNANIARALIAGGKLPNQLPVASETTRRMVEALTRRTGAAIPQ